MKKVGKLWKDWKNRLKARYYTPYKHDKSYVKSKCPSRVEAEQWPTLVNYWSSSGAKTLSKTNRNSRKCIQLPPRMGRKDQACAKEEYRREYGKEPSKVDLFIFSRNKKDGKLLDPHTEEKIAKLKELKRKLPDELVDDIDANNEIFEEVIGREAPGCLRGNNTASKSKHLVFTSREDFDRVVQEKSSEKVESIEKKFEEQFLAFQNKYCSQVEILQSRLHTLEDQNIIGPSLTSNSRRIQAPNNRTTQAIINFGNNNEDNGTNLEEQGKGERRSNKRKEK